MIRQLLMAGCIAGLVAGLSLSVMQQFQVLPLIETAERYEVPPPLEHDGSLTPVEATPGEWMPQQGAERFFYTLAANLGMSVGFSLILCAVFVFFEPKFVWHGTLWGLAGYMVFFLAPALKLPPELPGAATFDLQSRQLWWIATVLCSAVGLFGIVFSKQAMLKLLAAGFLALPHLLGGPLYPEYTSDVPEILVHQFVLAVGAVNFVFWIVLGLATSWSYRVTHSCLKT
jgi:cobalt transporter subunit CbtA